MTIESAYNYRRVSERISTAGVVPQKLLEQLAGAGFTAVISLLPDSSEYAVAGERDIVEQQGLEYIYIPVDFDAPTESDYQEFKDALTAADANRTSWSIG